MVSKSPHPATWAVIGIVHAHNSNKGKVHDDKVSFEERRRHRNEKSSLFYHATLAMGYTRIIWVLQLYSDVAEEHINTHVLLRNIKRAQVQVAQYTLMDIKSEIQCHNNCLCYSCPDAALWRKA